MPSSDLTWVAGASGLIGRELLAQLGDTPVLALVRRPLSGLPNSALRHEAIVDLAALPTDLPVPRRVFIALGTTMAQAGSQ
ncbi:MAG: hypothetical protein V3V71_01200, partial [Roseateles sp.]